MIKFVAVLAFVACTSAVGPLSSGGHIGDSTHASSHGSSEDVHAEIKSLESEVNHEGFKYSFETSNHIKAVASSDDHGNVHGDFEWVSPEGEHVAVKYIADEFGYQPSSNVLPTSPPVPAAILKALEYIRSHPSQQEQHGKH